jgi:hypothetical protein
VNRRPVPDSAAIVAAGDVLSTALGDEVVMLNLRDGVYYGLDAVGARVWTLLSDPLTVAAIRDALVDEYDVDPARCEDDVRTLVEELASRGLVEILEPS